MSRKRKDKELDALEGFSFEAVLGGAITEPEAYAPIAKEIRNEAAVEDLAIQTKKDALVRERESTSTRRLKDPGQLNTDLKKLSQSEAKVEPLHEPKLSQSEAKVEPNLSRKKTKVEPQPEPLHEPKLSQSEAKVEPNFYFDALIGLQRNALIFLYDSCRLSGSKTSAPISIQNLANGVNTTVAAARKALQRLEQKNYIKRAEFKDGRGGWTKYALPDKVYNQLLMSETRAKVEPKLGQTRAKVETEPEPQPEPSLSSSSSSLSSSTLKKEELTTVAELTGAWSTIQTPDELKRIGFGTAQLRQIIDSNKLNPEEVQTSLNQFAYDLTDGLKTKTGPLNFLMGILLKRGPYSSSKYLQAEEQELNDYLALAEKVNASRIAKLKCQQEEQFELWFSEMSIEKKMELVPPTNTCRIGSTSHKKMLERYFLDHVWNDQQSFNNSTDFISQVSRELGQKP